LFSRAACNIPVPATRDQYNLDWVQSFFDTVHDVLGDFGCCSNNQLTLDDAADCANGGHSLPNGGSSYPTDEYVDHPLSDVCCRTHDEVLYPHTATELAGYVDNAYATDKGLTLPSGVNFNPECVTGTSADRFGVSTTQVCCGVKIDQDAVACAKVNQVSSSDWGAGDRSVAHYADFLLSSLAFLPNKCPGGLTHEQAVAAESLKNQYSL
jgi:hypothetical protein